MYNDDNELVSFKTDINIGQYLESIGFTFYPKKSSRNQPAFIGPNNEILATSVSPDNNHHRFINIHNPYESGSIIDLVQALNKTMNLGQVRVHLRDYSNINKGIAPSYIPKLHHVQKDDPEVLQSLFDSLVPYEKRSFLHKRGISNQTIDSDTFKGQIYNEIFTSLNGKKFVNTVFPIFNDKGFCGLERRNDHFKKAAKNSDKYNGMWHSSFNDSEPSIHKEFHICESPLDCISKFQIRNYTDNKSHLFLSSNGSLSGGHINYVNKKIELCKPNNVFLSNDNDSPGLRFSICYYGQLIDYRASKDLAYLQNNLKFICRAGDTKKQEYILEYHLFKDDNPLFDKIENHVKNKFSILAQNLNGNPSYKENSEKVYAQLPFLNTKANLITAFNLVKEVRPVHLLTMDLSNKKDFNEELVNNTSRQNISL